MTVWNSARLLALFALLTSSLVLQSLFPPDSLAESHWGSRLRAARALMAAKHHGQAEAMFLAALKDAESQRENDLRLQTSLRALADFYLLTGQHRKSLEYYEQELVVLRRRLDSRDRDLADNLHLQATAYGLLGDRIKEIRLLKAALPIYRQTPGEAAPFTIGILWTIGGEYRALGNFREAERYLKQAYDLKRQNAGSSDPYTGYAARQLGSLYKEQKRYEEARQLYRAAAEIAGKHKDFPALEECGCAIAETFEHEERLDAAGEVYRHTLASLGCSGVPAAYRQHARAAFDEFLKRHHFSEVRITKGPGAVARLTKV